MNQPLEAGQPTTCPHLLITPQEHQYSALAKIEFSKDGDLEGMVLADPPGLGKTLPAMMAVVKAIPTATRPSIIVAPASCVDQWCSEFEKFFTPVGRFSHTLPFTLKLTKSAT
jgi:SNF2 family DNA or RNA helicase